MYPVGQAVVCNIEIEPDELPPDIFISEPEPDNVNEPVTVSEHVPPDKVYPDGHVKYAPEEHVPLVGVEPSEQTGDCVSVSDKDKGMPPEKVLLEES